jgi:hypothetical protein
MGWLMMEATRTTAAVAVAVGVVDAAVVDAAAAVITRTAEVAGEDEVTTTTLTATATVLHQVVGIKVEEIHHSKLKYQTMDLNQWTLRQRQCHLPHHPMHRLAAHRSQWNMKVEVVLAATRARSNEVSVR